MSLTLPQQAAALAAQGKHHLAVSTYRKAINDSPDRVELYANLAVSLAAGGDLDGAILAARCALMMGTEIPELLINLGRLLLRAGQDREGIIWIRRSLGIHLGAEPILAPWQPKLKTGRPLALLRLCSRRRRWSRRIQRRHISIFYRAKRIWRVGRRLAATVYGPSVLPPIMPASGGDWLGRRNVSVTFPRPPCPLTTRRYSAPISTRAGHSWPRPRCCRAAGQSRAN